MDPAVVLAALASMVEETEASIVRLQAVREAQLALAQRFAEDLAAADGPVSGESAELAQRSVAAELAGVLHMSDRVVQARMARAADLMTRFPHTMRAFTEARINAAHVRLIQDAGGRPGSTTHRSATVLIRHPETDPPQAKVRPFHFSHPF